MSHNLLNQLKKIKELISQNKGFLFCLVALLALFATRACPAPVVNPPVQKEQKKLETKKQEDRQQKKRVAVSKRNNRATTTVIKEYSPETGKLIKETKKETRSEQQVNSDVKTEKTEVIKKDEKREEIISYSQPYTGITVGAAVLPTGAGVTAGATILEVPPVTISAQLVYMVQPQQAPAIGVSLNGTVAPRLEAGVGVYVGPQTSMGYDPVPGVPVSIQPGVLIQYRF